MKPFDLEAAKQGAPVITRDGRPARIICFDFKVGNFFIIALVMNETGFENQFIYSQKGQFSIGEDDDLDLVMKPQEIWVNIYIDHLGDPIVGAARFESEQEAKDNCIEFPAEKFRYITSVNIARP